MGDPTKFFNMTEYYIQMIGIIFILLCELSIWLFTSSPFVNKGKKKKSDNGSMLLLIFCFCFSVFISYLFISHSMPTVIRDLLFPHAFYYIGIAFMFGGTILRVISVWTLKRAFTLSVQTTESQHLIQKGPYKFVRNPAYTGSIISMLGIAFSLRNILSAICVFIVCILCYFIRIRIEEKALRQQFGKKFDDYCTHTWRLLPYVW